MHSHDSWSREGLDAWIYNNKYSLTAGDVELGAQARSSWCTGFDGNYSLGSCMRAVVGVLAT